MKLDIARCELYYVNRDTLFSYHKASEQFLQRMMSLYVSSHYKNSPNDLQLMSDAPAHHLFVLLGPVKEDQQLPDILCVIQVCQTACQYRYMHSFSLEISLPIALTCTNHYLIVFYLNIFSALHCQVCLEGEISKESIM